MDFTTSFSVIIAGRIVTEVNSVITKYDSKHIGSSCDIVIPLNVRLQYVNGPRDYITAYSVDAFKVGDVVSVTASYPNTGFPPVTLFKGYVFEFKEGTPCTIRCIDYLPLLGHIKNKSFKSITLKELVTWALTGTGISLILPMVDLTLVNVTFRLISPWGILDWIKKNIGINIALYGNRLYCNVASNTLNTVKFATDRNLHYSNLQKPEAVWQQFKVKAWFLKNNGTRDSLEVGDGEGHLTEVFFYNVKADLATYTRLAGDALDKIKQRKYSGEVRGYLYPDCQLFDRVEYTDIRYPEKSGNYIITAISHSLSDAGFHKSMHWAFLTDFLNLQN